MEVDDLVSLLAVVAAVKMTVGVSMGDISSAEDGKYQSCGSSEHIFPPPLLFQKIVSRHDKLKHVLGRKSSQFVLLKNICSF